MSAITPVDGEMFVVRTIKSFVASPERQWANSYELGSIGGATTYTDLVQAGIKLMDMERLWTLNSVRFTRLLISTYVSDGSPYDPHSFISLPLDNITGALGASGLDLQLPLQVALYARRVVASGRYGKIMYRGALLEPDVNGAYDGWTLSNPNTISDRFAQAITASGVASLMADPGVGNLRLMMFGRTAAGINQRTVQDIIPVAARIVTFNNRYFDRA